MSTGFSFPWEKAAMRGEELPDGLSLPDQMAYTCETLTGPITTRPFPAMRLLLRSSESVSLGNEPSAEQRLTRG